MPTTTNTGPILVVEGIRFAVRLRMTSVFASGFTSVEFAVPFRMGVVHEVVSIYFLGSEINWRELTTLGAGIAPVGEGFEFGVEFPYPNISFP
jgi:hypothetical protein